MGPRSYYTEHRYEPGLLDRRTRRELANDERPRRGVEIIEGIGVLRLRRRKPAPPPLKMTDEKCDALRMTDENYHAGRRTSKKPPPHSNWASKPCI